MVLVWLWQQWILLNYMADNLLISLMLAVNSSHVFLISSFLFLGGVKEEQVLDAFKILFNDNQVRKILL
jgi:hypothetical protein